MSDAAETQESVVLARLIADLLDADPGRFVAEVAESNGPLFAKLVVSDAYDGTRFAVVVEELGRG